VGVSDGEGDMAPMEGVIAAHMLKGVLDPVAYAVTPGGGAGVTELAAAVDRNIVWSATVGAVEAAKAVGCVLVCHRDCRGFRLWWTPGS